MQAFLFYSIFACMTNSQAAPAWSDTIVALSTPPGIGALGVVRLSGPQAIAIADALMPGKKIANKPSHTLHVGWLKYNGYAIDEVVISLFRNPKSFTGEDVIEISCHGSPYILQQTIDACIALGARLAKPGEFTQRAFLNGKMDLAQAEAVADIIASQTAAAQQAALHQMRGGFSHELAQLREQLIQFSALIELELDFATEDVEFADRTALQQLLVSINTVVQQLMNSFKLGNVIKEGVSVAIIGKPNAGKSTLLNALLNENRAIVSEIAGTTRDTIEEVLNIDGILFRLIDTAGIRQSGDVIESIGVEKSLEKLRKADVVLYLFDVHSYNENELKEAVTLLKDNARQFVLIGNKADHAAGITEARLGAYTYVPISAKSHINLDLLKTNLVQTVMQGKTNQESTIVTNARHFAALQEVHNSLTEIQQGLSQHIPGDLIALDIRHCLHFLGEITGTITNEDQLDFIFSKFCIGK